MRKKFIYQIFLDKLEDFLGLTQYLGHSLSFIHKDKKYQEIIYSTDVLSVSFNDVLDSRKVEIVLKTDTERECFEKFFARDAFIEKLFDKRCFIPVSALNLSSRHEYSFLTREIEYIGDLLSWSEKDMLRLRGFGKKSLGDLNNVLTLYGLKLLGSKISNWPNKNERKRDGIVFPEVDAEKYKLQ